MDSRVFSQRQGLEKGATTDQVCNWLRVCNLSCGISSAIARQWITQYHPMLLDTEGIASRSMPAEPFSLRNGRRTRSEPLCRPSQQSSVTSYVKGPAPPPPYMMFLLLPPSFRVPRFPLLHKDHLFQSTSQRQPLFGQHRNDNRLIIDWPALLGLPRA